MRLAWTPEALEDRRAIYDYIEADNPGAALDLDELLSEKATRLIDHPGLGRPGRVEGTRELVAHRNDVAGDSVRVLRVLLDALRATGCEKVFTDKASGTKADGAGLTKALAYAREGDCLDVWKLLDRLGRSMKGAHRAGLEAAMRAGRVGAESG